MKAPLIALSLVLSTHAAFAAPNYAERVGQKRLELALTLSHALDDNAICDAEAYPSEIVKQISSGHSLVSPERFGQFLAALKPGAAIRRNFAFRATVGEVDLWRADLSEGALAKSLVGTTFYHFGQGAYGSGYNVTFQTGGRAVAKSMDLLDKDPWFRWKTRTVAWKLVRVKNEGIVPFVLVLDGTEFRLVSSGEGEYRWVPNDVKEDNTTDLRTLNSEDAYCDA